MTEQKRIFGVLHLLMMTGLIGILSTGCGEDENNSNDENPDSSTQVNTDDETDSTSATGDPMEIVPGSGIGDLKMGMTVAQVEGLIGPNSGRLGFSRTVYLSYPELGLEVVVTSQEDIKETADSIVIAIGADVTGNFNGIVTPGASKSQIEATLGQPAESVDGFAFFKDGLGVQYEGDTAVKVAVFNSYELTPDPPEMKHADE